MKDILEEIVAHKRRETERLKQMYGERELWLTVERECRDEPPSMAQALARSGTGIIAEFKRKSPSTGWINAGGSPDAIPLDYQRHGAAAISILTDEKFFGGRDEFVCRARQSGVTLPILYKNFVTDSYQLLRARLCGASAVLLIAACLGKAECAGLIALAHSLGIPVAMSDISEKALAIASCNYERNIGAAPDARLGSLFEPWRGERFDIIATNPPYLTQSWYEETDKDVKAEPSLALLGGDEDGLGIIRSIISLSPDYLNEGGVLAIECDYRQTESCARILRNEGFSEIAVARDAAGKERVVHGTRLS